MAEDALARLVALDDPVRRRLFEYVRSHASPVGREQAAEASGIARSLAAYHLDKLEEAGLLSASYERPEGRSGPGAGRPAKLYAVAEAEVSASIPAREYEFAAQLLAEAAEAEPGARAALRAVAARSGREAHGDLFEVLAEHGYEPFEDEPGVIRLRNCPFHKLAESHRDLVCGMNQAYLDGVLEGLDRADVTASLEPEPGRCCVAIRRRGKR